MLLVCLFDENKDIQVRNRADPGHMSLVEGNKLLGN